jgi:hypothetical protein
MVLQVEQEQLFKQEVMLVDQVAEAAVLVVLVI